MRTYSFLLKAVLVANTANRDLKNFETFDLRQLLNVLKVFIIKIYLIMIQSFKPRSFIMRDRHSSSQAGLNVAMTRSLVPDLV